jgi:hypothetical protein
MLNKFVVAAVMALFLAACGGGGGGGSDSASNTVSSGGTGSVGLLLTDGPTDDFDAVFITVVKAELLADSGSVTIFEGEETLNLLDYRNDARIFALNPGVPAGTYEKIRLTLSDIELVKCVDDVVIQPIDVDICTNTINPGDQPRLKGNNKLDLNPGADFVVVPGGTLMVEIDIDAEKSIHIVETGNGKYQFRPVVFVNILSDGVSGKLVRIHGIIADLDRAAGEFEICSREINLLPSIDVIDHDLTCVDVKFNDDTAIFGPDCTFCGPEDLFNGDEATVIGHLRLDDEDDDEVEHHESDGDHNHYDFDGVFIQALVIEIGPDGIDDTLDGIALTTVDDRFLFDMSINPGQGYTEGSEITVQILPGTTSIVERDGSIVPISAIQPGSPLSVDGEIELPDTGPALLLASLIVVDTEASTLRKESGTIGLIPDQVCGFYLDTGIDSVDLSVKADNKNTRVLSINGTDVDIIPVEALEKGDLVNVYGQDDDVQLCFVAEIIVVFDKLVPEPR